MAAFATYSDLQDRWKPLSATEQTTATVLLDDASTRIRLECSRAGVDADGDVGAAVTKMVACGMVKRAMLAGNSEGFSQVQDTAGPFSHNVTVANPTGNLYLTKQDRRDLGCVRQRAFQINPFAARDAEALAEEA